MIRLCGLQKVCPCIFNNWPCSAILVSASLVLPDGGMVAEEDGTIRVCVELSGQILSPVTLRIRTDNGDAEGMIHNERLMDFC